MPVACSASKRLSTELGRSAAQARTGSAMPLTSLAPRSCKLEQIAEQFSCALSDDDGVRLGNALQTRRKVRRLADDCLLLSRTRSDQVADDDEPGGDADAGLQRSAGSSAPLTACDQLQPRPYRPLGIVLMGLRIAEIHEHAVAHVLRHEPAEAAARSRRRTSDRRK